MQQKAQISKEEKEGFLSDGNKTGTKLLITQTNTTVFTTLLTFGNNPSFMPQGNNFFLAK